MFAAGNALSTPTTPSRLLSKNMKLLIVILTILGLVLASVSLARSLGVLNLTFQTKPVYVTVFGTVAMNYTGASDPTVTFIDMANPAQSVATAVTSGFYNLTVRNQNSYNIHLYYSVSTNNCSTNQAGNYVCLQDPQNCYRGPISVDVSSAFMRYDINCTRG